MTHDVSPSRAQFGSCVAFSGDASVLAVGSPHADSEDNGLDSLFRRDSDADEWLQLGDGFNATTGSEHKLGTAVAVVFHLHLR